MKYRLPMHQSSVQAVLTRLQRGVVLEVAIIILLLIAIVGLAVSRSSFMQDKMSANFYDRQITFQCAQAALRQGENAVDLSAGGVGGFRDCSPISGNNCLPDPFTDSSVMPKLLTPSAFTGTYAGTPAAALLDGQQLQYVVEYLGSFNSAAGGVTSSSFNLMNQCSNYEQCGDSNSTASEFYRITARCGPTGTSGRATTVTLQTVYRR